MAIQSMGDEVFTMKTLLGLLGDLQKHAAILRANWHDHGQSETSARTIERIPIGDIYRIVGSYMLKNAGHSVRDVQTMTDEVVSSEEFVRNLATENDRKLAWHEAMKASIDRLRAALPTVREIS